MGATELGYTLPGTYGTQTAGMQDRIAYLAYRPSRNVRAGLGSSSGFAPTSGEQRLSSDDDGRISRGWLLE